MSLASLTGDTDAASAKFAQLNRLMLEFVLHFTTGRRPEKDLLSILLWTKCLAASWETYGERLHQLVAANPDVVP